MYFYYSPQSAEPTCICVALQALSNSESLWYKYLRDFAHQKLHLDLEIPGIVQKVFVAAFGKLSDHKILTRLAILHSYVHVHRVSLAQIVAILHPLNSIDVTTSIIMPKAVFPPVHSFISDVEESGDFLGKPETLSMFLIESLFKALVFVAQTFYDEKEELSSITGEQVELWYQTYHDMVSCKM